MIKQIVLTDYKIIFNLNEFDQWKIPHGIVQLGQHEYSPSPTNSHGGPTSNVPGGDLDKRNAMQTITDEL